MQTAYHAHTPGAAGMTLAMKELVGGENVPRTYKGSAAGQQRGEGKAPRGFVVIGLKVGSQ